MKSLYITFLNEDIRPGYKMKIHSQCKAFYDLGYDSYLYIVKKFGMGLYQIKEEEHLIKRIENKRKRKSEERNIVDEFHLIQRFSKELIDVAKELNPDIVYIRRIVPANPWVIKFMKYLKRNGIKIIYEYPTYPWAREMLQSKQFFLFFIEQFFYRTVEKKADVIAYLGKYNGKNNKFVQIFNGVDVSKFKKHSRVVTGDIGLIGVAHVAYYHGYDRVIRGLADYYRTSPDQKVIFHIVGPIDEKLALKELVEELQLQEYVIFYGMKTGKELDDIFDRSDIGIEGLGSFRRDKNMNLSASLKSREYTARGIPHLRATEDIVDISKVDFIFKINDNDTPVDIGSLLRKFQEMKSSEDDIRKWAQDKLAWKSQIKKVLEPLNMISHLD